VLGELAADLADQDPALDAVERMSDLLDGDPARPDPGILLRVGQEARRWPIA